MKRVMAFCLIFATLGAGWSAGLAGSVAGTALGRTPAPGTTPERRVSEAGFMQQLSYALGVDVLRQLSRQVDLDPDFFFKGVGDAVKKTPELSEDQIRQMLMAYQRLARKKAREDAASRLEKNRAEGSVFLEGNKLKAGVVSLSSGLQYKVITEGTGPVPKSGDTVECRYRGTLINGREFDSSETSGRPAVFQVDQVIQGFREALLRMKEGSRWILYIPSDLAYGDQGAGTLIEPGHTLIFEVELLGIVK